MRRRITFVLSGALVLVLVLAGTAFAQFSGPPGVTITPGGENCNGIIPTPGSENTVKSLIGGTLVPGGTAIYRIAYPVDPTDVGDAFQIVDCVLMGTGADLKTYTVLDEATFDGVVNSTAFVLDFTFNIPANATLGDAICNVAKTTEGPSAPSASNRKAGPACFIIGGDARIEKHSTTDPTGDPIPGATFAIGNCVNTALDPAVQPLIINGVSYPNTALAPYAGHGTISILATTGVITFSGAVGSHCDVTETAPPPGYTLPAQATQTVTISSATEQSVINFLDPPAPGAIQITKVAPTGASGTVFSFTISCTNPTNTYTLTITGSGTATQNNVPAGSVCSVNETDPGSTFNTPVIDPSGTFVVGSLQTVVVTVTNSFKPGAIHITKVAPAGESGTVFHFTITCTNPAHTYTAQITGSGTADVTGIPAGSVCTVTEDPLPGKFGTPVISPSGPFTVGANQTVNVTVTNVLNPGSLQITKSSPAGTSFTFDIACVNPTNTYQLVVPANGSATQSGIPAGSVCTVTEQVPATFATPTYSPSNVVTIVAAQTVTVSVVNSLLPGSLTVSKIAPAGVTGDFTFDVACTNPTNSYQLVVPANGSATQSGIPAGSVCTVTEQVPAGFAPPTYDPGQAVTILPDATVTVSATNTLLPLGLTVVKTASPISGAPGASVTYTYVVTNTGQVTLLNVAVDDDKLGHIGDIPVLAPGQSVTLTKTTTLPSVAGLLTNVATAVGHDEFGRTATDTDDAVVTVVLGVKIKVLPKTGAATGYLLLVGMMLLFAGALLKVAGRFRLSPSPASSTAGRRVLEQAFVRFRPVRRDGIHRRRPPDRAGP